MNKRRILVYLNEAIMEKEAKKLSRDILVLGVNLSHRRPHNGLSFRACIAVEIVLDVHCNRICHLHEEILASISRSQRNRFDQWFMGGERDKGSL